MPCSSPSVSSILCVTSVTYTATDRQDSATATAKYVLRLHDEIEKVGAEVVIPNPNREENLSGSAENGGVLVIYGRDDFDESGVTVNQGHATSSGGSIQLEADVPLQKMFKIWDITLVGAYQWSVTQEMGASYPLGTNLTALEKAYPVAVFTSNRHEQEFRHFTPPGEHILTIRNHPWPDDHPLHLSAWNIETGNFIQWKRISATAPNPE